MLELNLWSLKEQAQWERQGFQLFSFDVQQMRAYTKEHPVWVHFGPGNIFRAFIAMLQQSLLESGAAKSGLIAVAPYDSEVIEKIYRAHDCLQLFVRMHADGRLDKEVLGSIAEALVCNTAAVKDWERLQAIFASPSLQIASFTITEKGYKLQDPSGNYTPEVAADMRQGRMNPRSFMGRITSLAYERFQAGCLPIAFLSMDNCSHNGKKVRAAMVEIAAAWVSNKLVAAEFLLYLQDERLVAFPCSMIDKITPGPSAVVQRHLQECGLMDIDCISTGRNSHYAPFVNAEAAEYLVVEDHFPNGRPPLEKAGVIFTDFATVEKVEQMKVCTCLNPLHTALAVFGCLLGYTLIADEMKNPLLRRLVEKIGYTEGLPVVVDPGVLQPAAFIKEVLEVRLPNANIPDTPQRIASDTSQKVGIRFGKTIGAYYESMARDVQELTYIPLAIAGWCRYLLAIDDHGQPFTVSPDPLLANLQAALAGVVLGQPETLQDHLRPILSNADIFGLDLYAVGLGIKIEAYMKEMLAGIGAVENTLKKYL